MMLEAPVCFDLPGVGVALRGYRSRVLRRVFLAVKTIYGTDALCFIEFRHNSTCHIVTGEEPSAAFERFLRTWWRDRELLEIERVGNVKPRELGYIDEDMVKDLCVRLGLRKQYVLTRPYRFAHHPDLIEEIDHVIDVLRRYDGAKPLHQIDASVKMLSDPERSPLLRPTAGLGARIWRPSEDPEAGQYRGPLSSTAGCHIDRAHPEEAERYCHVGA